MTIAAFMCHGVDIIVCFMALLQAARPAVTLQPPVSQRMQAQLAGIRKITISAPGVLLEEWLPHELQVRCGLSAQFCLWEVKRSELANASFSKGFWLHRA